MYICEHLNIRSLRELCDLCSNTHWKENNVEDHIIQVDGNVSFDNSWFTQPSESSFNELPSAIPVVVSSRSSSFLVKERRNCFNQRIVRNNKTFEALNLPAFTVYNMRSLWSKLNNLAEDIIERSVDISFLSEVWEKKENLKHQSSIEELLEMKGILYISTPRPGLKRGGGAAIAACPTKFSLVKLHIEIPKSLEVVWGILRPKRIIGRIRKIIICSFYSPPRSRKKTILIDHILTVLNKLRTEHPDAATIIAGDKNDLDENGILAFDPSFSQIVMKPTRKDKVLSIIITDLRRFFVEPKVVAPIAVDNPQKGVPSDHNGVLAIPVNNRETTKNTTIVIKFVKPMPESSIIEFRHSIRSIKWPLMMKELSSSDMVDVYQKMTTDLSNIHFPLKKISVSPYDKPWITEELKAIRRRRQRIYRKEGRSSLYLEVKAEFDTKLEAEATKYRNKIQEEVANGKRGSSYSAIRKLGNRQFEAPVESFDIPEFIENNFDDKQAAEALADHFSSISQEFQPIDVNKFPPNIKDELDKGRRDENIPILEEHEVHKKIISAKKPHSTVPGDLKRELIKECSVELVPPVTVIYNKITQSKEFPRLWVNEQQTAIPKVTTPSSMDDLRNISGTPFMSKQYESFISDWLLPIVNPYLDPGQCGGLKKSSISHYLIKLLHYIHYNLDRPQPHAVLLACVDMSKAFNRMSHQKVIEDLFDMKVPGWLLLILISYLTDRKMNLKFRGVLSALRSLPGSSPQGTVLGVILFIIYFNGAALRPTIPRPSWPFFSRKRNDPAAVKMKFVDDLSIAVKVHLQDDIVDDIGRQRPHTFDERLETKLSESNALKDIMDQLEIFSADRQMKVNSGKSCIMKICKSRSKAFPTEIKLDDSFLEVKKEMKILGVILTPNLKWHSNTDYICRKAYRNMWMIRRMKKIGLDAFTLIDYYMKEVRVHLELAAPVWHSGLSQKLSADIERVQRIAVRIILDNDTIHYDRACVLLGLKPLFIRRQELCERFAVKTASPGGRHNDLFQLEKDGSHNTRSSDNKYREHICTKTRFFNSPLPYLTRTLNQL